MDQHQSNAPYHSGGSAPPSGAAANIGMKMATQGATTAFKKQFGKVKTMAEEGSMTFRVAAFLGGIFMVITSILDCLDGLLHLSVIHVMIMSYVIIFALMICILEGKGFLPSMIVDHLQEQMHDNAKFLRFVWGRGVLYFFAGSLQFSVMSFFNMISGGFMMALGGLSIMVGRSTARKLSAIFKSMPDETSLRATFYTYAGEDGMMGLEEFRKMSENAGFELQPNELVAAFSTIDKSQDERLSYDEFKVWWFSIRTDQHHACGINST
uniref:Calmodulin n=1 Tax=Helicotheca tamesis TaxID=374047 RepID=A0A7S2MD96_9STRA|mmetsp:Transcript_13947/g.19090  ORF Transcript_13947/g.19090 Transcript_13947/m.19090 type:complete len:267 (+) Transcript_13947:70-870(+)